MKAGRKPGANLVGVVVVREVTIGGVQLARGTRIALPRDCAMALQAQGSAIIEREEAVIGPPEYRCL